jgi:para-aminobenzoate synthetase component 1
VSALEAARRLRRLPRPAFLDSSSTRGPGRHSYFTADPFLVLESRGRRCRLTGVEEREMEADPFALLQILLRRYRLPQSGMLPPFAGGAAGYFGYDLGRVVEPLPAINPEAGSPPEMNVGFYDWTVVTDHLTGESRLVSTGLPAGTEEAARRRLAEVRELLKAEPGGRGPGRAPVALRSNTGCGRYTELVRRAKEYIRAGDIYQVNLSHRLEGEWSGESWALYERLREVSPVTHGAYLDFGEVKVLSASPERFLKLAGSAVETRPIKGTRPRGATPEEDERLARELSGSEKDRAENLMIVDLLRNDLGKVCRTGSVRVLELYGLERHASVWHLVSTVRGELRPGLDAVDLLRACFPGGSVTGCPKIRAMEIIEELEPVRRGVYCGSVGYISFTGEMDTSIAIRTLVLQENRLHLQVGGAVVADSDPELEYRETLAKGRAVLAALGTGVDER